MLMDMTKQANKDPSNYTSQEVLIYNAQETELLFQSLDLITNNWRNIERFINMYTAKAYQ